MPPDPAPVLTVISGGQTGVDRAALDVALALGLGCGGWCPRGRRAEDGELPSRYPLRETASDEYAQRTEWNVRDADATLIIADGRLSGGTAYTAAVARRLGKPCLVVQAASPPPAGDIRRWLQAYGVRTLNVAGPRETTRPGIYAAAAALLREIFAKGVRPLVQGV